MTALQAIPVGIVEDDAAYRAHLIELVNQAGRFQCVGDCESGEAALEQLPQLQPQIALVDLELPGMHGHELIPRLRGLTPRLGVIVLTKHDDDAHLFGALEAGALGYLTKPLEPDELASALDLLQAGGAPMTAAIARRVLNRFHQVGRLKRTVASLTTAERQLLEMLASGMTIESVALEVNRSARTVHSHLKVIYEKLQANGLTAAVARYVGATQTLAG